MEICPLAAAGGAQLVRAVDGLGQLSEQPLADGGVTLCGVGVVADEEPVIGVDVDFFDLQVTLRVWGRRSAIPARRPAPAHGAQVDVGLDLAFAEEFGEPAAGDVVPEVHLPGLVLRVQVALCAQDRNRSSTVFDGLGLVTGS